MKQNALILIPARFGSSRFPGKPIAKILDKPMIVWVYEGAYKVISKYPNSKVVIVTDDQRIEDVCREWGKDVVRVDDDVSSGSERIQLAYERYYKDENFDLVINVQGDEPLIEENLLSDLISFHLNSDYDVATVVKEIIGDQDQKNNPNKVKAIFNKDSGKCHYFSRAPVPFDRDGKGGVPWYLHIGVYSYRPNILKKFCSLSQSLHEQFECLEQLRLLDNGMSIGAVTSDVKLLGVDTPEDIVHVEEVLNGK